MNERQAAIVQLNSMIQDIDVAMFTTEAQSGLLRSRPMMTASRNFDGDLWFFTSQNDPRVGDIKANSRVGISYACPNAKSYVSISGTASIVDDEQKFEALWRDDLKEWFPDGLESIDLTLIKVQVDCAEYWDHSQSVMVRLLSYVKSIITGESNDAVAHEELNWPRAVTAVSTNDQSAD
ncbi:MAG: pyridoxamine 5'-phosphate oxidase family protein [Rhodopirellula sp.]|nr:pyridoxamine 5'-phosphate oxidase family protein [Rhodopirellula sp.]